MNELTIPKIMIKDRSLADMIPYSHHVSDTVIATKNGDYVSTIKVVGRAHIAADIEDVNKWVRDLNTNMRAIPAHDIEHVSFYVHVVRRYEKGFEIKKYENDFCQDVANKYSTVFDGSGLMVNEIYITIIFRPVTDKVNSFFARFEKSSLEDRLDQQNAYIQKLTDISDLIKSGIRSYEPTQLTTYDYKGRMYCQMLELFAYLITHKRTRVPVTRERYYNYLSTNRLLFSAHGELGEIRHIDHSKFFGMLEVKEYDNFTVPGHFNTLMQADCELIITQSFTIISKVAALGYLKRHKKFLIDSEDVAISQIQQMDQAMDQLMSGAFVMGQHHMTTCAYGDTPSKVKASLQSLSTDLTEVGIIPTFLDIALEAGFFAQLPGNYEMRPRPAVITSENFWSFNSLHNFMTGKADNNPWGKAVTMFRSMSGTPYFFNFHRSPKDENSVGKKYDGNTLMFGKTGAGKTTLCAFLFAQLLSVPNLRLVAFDKDRGLEIFIRAVGGKYLPLETGKPTGFNPFQLPDNNENRKFVRQWLHDLLKGDDYGINFNDERELDKAIEVLYNHDQQDRQLSIFQQGLPNPISDEDEARPSVRQRLKKWCGDGQYGWVFDNAKDTLDVTQYNIYGFDVTDFLDIPDLRSVMILYLTYRTQQLIDGTPFVYFFDEFWKLAEDVNFQDLFKNKLKTIRKENGICVFASQEPNDALSSPIAKTIVSQCATQILLENPKADYDDYVHGLKLSETEYDLVKNIPDKSYQFLVKQGGSDLGQSSMIKFHLPNFDKQMLVLSGTPDNAEQVNEIIDRIGSDKPKDWLPVFYEEHGFT